MRPLTLLEAEIRLYREGAGGLPLLESPVWTGICAEQLRMDQRPIERETWPTAVRYPQAHHIGEAHTIDIEKLWAVQGVTPFDYVLELNQRYVLVIEWEERGGESRLWHRRVYYGVTDTGVRIDSAVEPLTPKQGIAWRAERMEQTGGLTVLPEYTGPEIRYRVKWVAYGESFWLFDYDLDSSLFTEVQEGLSTGRAAIENAIDFEASIEGVPVCWTDSGILFCHELVEEPGIAPVEKPRLEFYVDDRRVATMGAGGVLRVYDLTEETISGSPAGFQFLSASELVAVLNGDGLVAEELTEE